MASKLPTHGTTPTVHMDKPDHRAMTSTGSSRQSKIWRQEQADLIGKGKFSKAMEMDIVELKDLYGSKYNAHIGEMLEMQNKKG